MDIVITVGPSLNNKRTLISTIRNGANILRLNFSHRNLDFFSDVIKAGRYYKKNIKIMQDLPGKKIRISEKYDKVIKVSKNEKVIFTGYDCSCQSGFEFPIIPLNISRCEIVSNNISEISIKDGTMTFKVIAINGDKIMTEAVDGGVIRAGKGCNIKGFKRKTESLCTQEKNDIDWACSKGVDIICQSFVEKKEDITKISEYINDKNIKVWAKVETLEGIENILEILEVADGVVIGRGDLVPETSLLKVPIFQEKVLKKVKEQNKEIIIATHILDNMKKETYPLLSEAESVYNFIQKGVDGFLLAGETSVGKNPAFVIEVLNKMIFMYTKDINGYNNK